MASVQFLLFVILLANATCVDLRWKCDETDETNSRTYVCKIRRPNNGHFDICLARETIIQSRLVVKNWRRSYHLQLGNECPQLKTIELLPRNTADCNNVPHITMDCSMTLYPSHSTTTPSTTTTSTTASTTTSTTASTTTSTTASTTTTSPGLASSTSAGNVTRSANFTPSTSAKPKEQSSAPDKLWSILGCSAVGAVFLLCAVVLCCKRRKGRPTVSKGLETENPTYGFNYQPAELAPPTQMIPMAVSSESLDMAVFGFRRSKQD